MKPAPTDTTTSVTHSIVVEAPVERAFHVFTDEIATWWNPDHHIIEAPLETMVFDSFVGGHVYDVGTDGSQCKWSRVLAYEPPARVVFTWDIDSHWQLEPDPARCSEIEVRFVPQGADRTLVEMEHRHLDRHGDGWEGIREAVGSGHGWGTSLRLFAETVARG